MNTRKVIIYRTWKECSAHCPHTHPGQYGHMPPVQDDKHIWSNNQPFTAIACDWILSTIPGVEKPNQMFSAAILQ